MEENQQNPPEGDILTPSAAQSVPQRRPWKWSKKRETAAVLVAEDEFTDQEIANQLGIDRSTVTSWKLIPDFGARVESLVKTLGNVALRHAAARRNRRVKNYNDTIEKAQRVIEQRAQDPDMADVPGGDTGLLVRQVKGIGQGDSYERVEEFAVDVALMREMRETMKQLAQELGQWQEKHDVTSGGQVIKTYIGVDLDNV